MILTGIIICILNSNNTFKKFFTKLQEIFEKWY